MASCPAEWLSVAVEVAESAGEMIRTDFESLSTEGLVWKSSTDPATSTDRRVESFVFSELRRRFPDHGFIGEESSPTSETLPLDFPTWVVDPLDGTTNFVHRFRNCCVSVALCVRGEPVVGVVRDPMRRETFTATKGGGAFCNGSPLRVSGSRNLSEALVGTNVGYSRDPQRVDLLFDHLKDLVLKGQLQGVRMTGSAALALASVACGRTCGFYEFGVHVWDIAAGVLLVSEAGGVSLSYSGGPLDLSSRQIVSGTPGVVRSLCDILKDRPLL